MGKFFVGGMVPEGTSMDLTQMSESLVAALADHRDRLTVLLQINPDDREWQQLPEARPSGSDFSAVQWLVELRKRGTPRGQLVSRLDLALDEIAGALYEYQLIWIAINHGPGIGAVRRTLRSIAADPSPYVNGTREIDHITVGWLEPHYPGGLPALDPQPLKAAALKDAAIEALDDLPEPARGRPKGRRDEAAARLGPRLAQIYSSYAEQNPTRRVDQKSHQTRGPFKEFVAEVMGALPKEYRTSAKGGLKGVDHIVLLGVNSLKRRLRKAKSTK